MPVFARSMTCLAVLFVLALIGCKADPKQTETAGANETVQNEPAQEVEAIEPRAAAERRLEAAEENLTSRRDALKRFLSNESLERFEERMSCAALELQQRAFARRELEQTHRRLAAEQSKLREQQRQGTYRPAADEMKILEQSNDIVALDKQLEELSSVRDRELRKFDGGGEVVDIINERIDGLQAERRKAVKQKASVLLNAKIEQAAQAITLINFEIDMINQELEDWTEIRRETVRSLDAYEQLARELEEAERERDEAKRALEAINASDR